MKTRVQISVIIAGLALPLSIALLATPEFSETMHCAPSWGFDAQKQTQACADEGEVRFKSMFGRRFLHMGDMFLNLQEREHQTVINESGNNGDQPPSFLIGDTISILHAPNGDRFIGVNSLTVPASGNVVLPFGWTLETHELSNSIETELMRQMLAFYFDGVAHEQEPNRAEQGV